MISMPRGIFKRKKTEPKPPIPIILKKFTMGELKKYALSEALQTVKYCRPGITLGEIMQMDMEDRMGGKLTKEGKEIVETFRKVANEFCKRHGCEPLF